MTLHTCVRCGREATSLGEIHSGCPCGSKVFVFNNSAGEAPKSGAEAQEQQGSKGTQNGPQAGQLDFPQAAPSVQSGAKAETAAGGEGDGKAPESNFARTTFSTEDVENIKIVSEGVFFVNVNGLSKNPVVLKDEEGVYYVRLPLSGADFDEGKDNGSQAEGGAQGAGAKPEGNGKKVVAEEKEGKK